MKNSECNWKTCIKLAHNNVWINTYFIINKIAAHFTSLLYTWKKFRTDVYYLCSHSGFERRDGARNDVGR